MGPFKPRPIQSTPVRIQLNAGADSLAIRPSTRSPGYFVPFFADSSQASTRTMPAWSVF